MKGVDQWSAPFFVARKDGGTNNLVLLLPNLTISLLH